MERSGGGKGLHSINDVAIRCNVMRIVIILCQYFGTHSAHRYLVADDPLLAGRSTHYIVGEPLCGSMISDHWLIFAYTPTVRL